MFAFHMWMLQFKHPSVPSFMRMFYDFWLLDPQIKSLSNLACFDKHHLLIFESKFMWDMVVEGKVLKSAGGRRTSRARFFKSSSYCCNGTGGGDALLGCNN